MRALIATLMLLLSASVLAAETAQLGPRPFYLVDTLKPGPLKDRLSACGVERSYAPKTFSISHRGAPLMFPEHTREGIMAAYRMGAGIIECDVAFTKDRQLVCRHSQCDLHTTTDILARPALAAKCTRASTRPTRPPGARPRRPAARAISPSTNSSPSTARWTPPTLTRRRPPPT